MVYLMWAPEKPPFLCGSYSHARMAFRDLTYHEESDTGVEVLGPYQLHDLVQVGLDK